MPYYLTSILVGGLAAIGAWALVAPSDDPADGARGAGPGRWESERGAPIFLEGPHGLQAPPLSPIGCDPVVGPFVDPGLSRHYSQLTGNCLARQDGDLAPAAGSG